MHFLTWDFAEARVSLQCDKGQAANFLLKPDVQILAQSVLAQSVTAFV